MTWATVRRRLLQGSVAAGGLAMLGGDGFFGGKGALAAAGEAPARSSSARRLEPLAAACRDLYIYGLAALEMARARDRTMGGRANEFRHVRALASASSRRVTTPNNDTLYSSAWLDLRTGPIEIAIPASGQRYFSLALLDMHSNNFHIVGTRATGGHAHRFRLLPPDGSPGPGEVRAPTWWVWAQARTLASGDADLPAAHALQDLLELIPSHARPQSSTGLTPPPPVTAAEIQQLAAIAALLETAAPPATPDIDFLQRLRKRGLTAGALAAAAQTALPDDRLVVASVAGVAAARRDIAGVLEHPVVIDGWLYSRPTLGDFGTDYLYRAAVAVWGLAALPPIEAVYVRAVGPISGALFDGTGSWRIRFPPGRLPPVDAFWSLSLYEALPSGELFFFDNPLRRYAIGDRTSGLEFAADGSLEIRISADDPGKATGTATGTIGRANWLPCPRAPFALILRAYLPGPAFVDGSYRLPAVERL